jgi:hypothetical protein
MYYEVKRYKGNQFGIFAVGPNAFVLFGLKRYLIRRCKELNEITRKELESI